MNSTFIVVIIGLSGCGKSYMIDYVLKNANVRIKKVIAVTTRPPRKCEKDGVDKFFRTEKIFEEENGRNQYCFVNEVYDYKYAFYRRDFFSTCNLICELYYKNYKEMKLINGNCKSIYVRPSDIDILEAKLLERGSSKGEVTKRLQTLQKENYELEKLAKESCFDYIFTNDFTPRSVYKFRNLIESILMS
ncbi:MAG: hypothetical protein HFH72_12010 [Lachnospiraceae bacterium]|nr:hypothetical protein [Lachnospiraceae bacterium]